MSYPPSPPGGAPGGYPPGYQPGYPPGYAPGTPAPAGSSPPSIGTGIIVAGGIVIAALILLAAFMIVRLRGDGDDRVDLTRAQLAEAVLVADDVPDGEEGSASGGSDIRGDDVDRPSACRSLITRFEDDDDPISVFGVHSGDVEVLVENEETVVSHILVNHEHDLIAGYRELLDTCDGAEIDDDGDPATVGYDEIRGIEVGDRSIAFEYEVEYEDGTFRALIVAWERTGNVSELGVASNDPDTGEWIEPDRDLAEDLAATLDDRLDEAVEAAR